MRDILSQSLVVSMWLKPERGMTTTARGVRLFGYGSFALTMNHNAATDKAQLHAGPESIDLSYDRWTRVSYAVKFDPSSGYLGHLTTLEAGLLLSNASNRSFTVGGSVPLPSANVPVPVIFGANGYKGYMDEISIRPLSANTTAVQLSTEAQNDLRNQPAFNFPFDESVGSTSFTDTFNTQSNPTCFGDCPQAGIKGQVREARQFTGSQAVQIFLPNRRLESTDGFSISGWFKPTRSASSRANLVSVDGKPGAPRAYMLGNNLHLDCSLSNNIAQVPVTLNTWTHFALVVPPNSGAIRAFVNGRLVGTGTAANGCTGNSVELNYWFFGYQYTGMLDEFSGYYYALADEDVLSLYDYQRTWFDVSDTQQFTIDADKPTVALLGSDAVRTGTTTFAVSAQDRTTPIASVEYWDGSAWKPANQGAGTDPSLWSFNWTVPEGTTGSVTLRARATDRAGNSQETTRQFNIVTSAPQLTLTTTGTPPAVKDVLNINGTINNAVAIGTVDITAFGEDGKVLSAPTRATVTEDGSQWSVAIPIVNGYSGKVTFRYRATNTLGFEREEALTGDRTFDNVSAFAGVSVDGLNVGGANATLSGQATDVPFPSAPLIYLTFDDAPKDVVVEGEAMKKWLALTHNQYAAYGVGNVTADNQEARVNAQGVIWLADATTLYRMVTVPREDVTIMFDVTPDSVSTAKQHLLNDFASYGILLKENQLILEIGNSLQGARAEQALGVTLQAGQKVHLAVRIQRISATEQRVTTFVNGTAVGNPIPLTDDKLIQQSMLLPTIGNDSGTDFVGKIDNLAVFDKLLTGTDIYNIAKRTGQAVTTVEVGLRDDRERASETPLNWQTATLSAGGQMVTGWSYTLPSGLEGVYHLSLRVTDSTGNQTTYPAIWTGVIDTKAPQIALSGTAVNATCKATDFSLVTSNFACAQFADATGTAQTNFNEPWYVALYRGSTAPARLYTLEKTGATFDTTNNRAAACDLFGNCVACTATNDAELGNPTCTPFTPTGLMMDTAVVAADPIPSDDNRFSGFSMTTSYERPAVYPSWAPPEDPNDFTTEWVEISAYDVITDGVLSDFYYLGDVYTETFGLIEWTEALSATAYYVGWTTSSTADKSELTQYNSVVSHTQVLTESTRLFAHIQVEDNDGNTLTEVRGPFFVDGLKPPSLLQWNSVDDGQPTRFWETVQSHTDLSCYLIGEDDRPLYQLTPTDPRAVSQALYATWSDDYLALTYQGVDWNTEGDLHLYFDTQPGGALTAYNPYNTVEDAYALVTMPDFLTSLSTLDNPLDRMAADLAVIVEDANTLTLLEWNGTEWVEIDNSTVLFTQQTNTETVIWLPLNLFGVTAPSLEMWLTAFATEENAMQLWATMPANNRLNSPALYPEPEEGAFDLDSILVQLQHAILLTTNPDDIFDIDYCTNSIQFQESEIEMTVFAEPSGEVYEPLLNEGIRALIPSDIEPLLRNACGVSPSADSRVCNLINLWDEDYYGEEEEIGPYDLLPSSVGPNQTVTYTLGIANHSAREAIIIPTVHVSDGLLLDTSAVNGITRTIAAFDQISMTLVGQTTADVTEPIYIELAALEETGSEEQGLYLDYELYSAFVDHYIDSTGPISATIDRFDTIGLGDQLVSGIIIDQSDIAEVTLRTSLGTSATCTDILRIGTFESDFLCTVEIPAGTADGTLVEISVEARDIHGFLSSHHETNDPVLDAWTFEVDATPPVVEWLDEEGNPQIPGASAILTNTIDLWGAVIDEREVGWVEVCDTVSGVESCTILDPYVYDETSEAVRARALVQDDIAFWEYFVDDLPEQFAAHELSIVGVDAVENRSEILNITLLIDTRPPTITVTTTPENVAYSETNPFVISGSVADDSAIEYMEIEIARPDEQTVYEEVAFANGAWSYSSATGEGFNIGGEYAINVAAWDSVGNIAFTESYTVTLAKPADVFIYPPSISGTLPISPAIDGTPLSYMLTIEDADFPLGDEMQLTEVYLPDGLTATLVTTNTIEVSGQIEVLPEAGSVIYFITVEDLSGNQGTFSWVIQGETALERRIYMPIITKP
ncbi:MAG: Ig-like domain repeat protein [Anaerolineales bacterium]|nr:Ig-like domain repeat protein [Anaerolineales bacterium]